MASPGRQAGPAAASTAPEVAAARAAWRRRAVLVGGGFQVVFGALWLARGIAAVAPAGVGATAGLAALVAGMAGAVALRGTAPRPQGAAARTIARRLTAATVVQLLASFALPALVGAVAGARLVVPSILVTIGLLLVWLHREVGTPYQGGAGWALIGLAAASALVAGAAQVALAGLAAAAVLLGCAAAGFAWLHRTAATMDP